MVVSALSGVNRRAVLTAAAAIVLGAICAAGPLRAAPPSGDGKQERYRGEILGVDRENETFTLRRIDADGKDLVVFHVTPETVYENAGDGGKLSFADLAAGLRATVDAARRGGRNEAIGVQIKFPKKRS